jgi:hypothetical protein
VENPEAVLLSVYMIANKEESNYVKKEQVKELFQRFGRDAETFSKTVYDLVNRRDPQKLKEKDGKIGLTFQGMNSVSEIIGGDS